MSIFRFLVDSFSRLSCLFKTTSSFPLENSLPVGRTQKDEQWMEAGDTVPVISIDYKDGPRTIAYSVQGKLKIWSFRIVKAIFSHFAPSKHNAIE